MQQLDTIIYEAIAVTAEGWHWTSKPEDLHHITQGTTKTETLSILVADIMGSLYDMTRGLPEEVQAVLEWTLTRPRWASIARQVLQDYAEARDADVDGRAIFV